MAKTDEFQRQFDVSRETLERLERYESLLRKWTAKINLVSKSTLDDLWARHFSDSAQIFHKIDKGDVSLADFGSGGGFPGLVLAILAAEKRPDLRVSLVESDLRKSAFLTTVARDLDLSVQVYAERVEAVTPLASDVITARALASLEMLLGFAIRHVTTGGTCLFLKGETYKEEVEVARQAWDFDLETHESQTQTGAALLKITNLRSKQ